MLLPPLNDDTAATAGSARKMAATWLCRPTMAVKDTSSAASVVTWIWPMSSSGKKPLGMAMNSQIVPTSVASATSSTDLRWRRAMSSDLE